MTPQKGLTPRCKKPRDWSITKKEMGDKSTINIIKDTSGKPNRTYDDARNVKNYKGRVVDGR
jgi:hypothetical protein